MGLLVPPALYRATRPAHSRPLPLWRVPPPSTAVFPTPALNVEGIAEYFRLLDLVDDRVSEAIPRPHADRKVVANRNICRTDDVERDGFVRDDVEGVARHISIDAGSQAVDVDVEGEIRLGKRLASASGPAARRVAEHDFDLVVLREITLVDMDDDAFQ